MAGHKFYENARHAKPQRVFQHLKALPSLAQSKDQVPHQPHHRDTCPANRQPRRNPPVAAYSASLAATLPAKPVLPVSSSRFPAGKASVPPLTAPLGREYGHSCINTWCRVCPRRLPANAISPPQKQRFPARSLRRRVNKPYAARNTRRRSIVPSRSRITRENP